jgi:hypothetical protein
MVPDISLGCPIYHDLREENGFLLIEVFSKLINTQNYGHLDHLQVAVYYLSGVVILLRFGEFGDFKTMREDK